MFDSEIILKLVSAIIIGGLIGLEREYRDRAAGFRTMILITTGAMLFTYMSIYIGGEQDAARITAAVVTGIGFLGAGAILVYQGKVQGLTTASTIWLSAALGVAVGAGAYGVAYLSAAAALAVLWFLPTIEQYLDKHFTHMSYSVTVKTDYDVESLLDQLHEKHEIVAENIYRARKGEVVTLDWRARGHVLNHKAMTDELMVNPHVSEVSTS